MPNREQLLHDWLSQVLNGQEFQMELASGDASFRRYFRVHQSNMPSRIVMDAPPERENTAPYIHVAGLLRDAGVEVPEIHAVDREQGFMLLSDLGATEYSARLAPATVDGLYQDAMDTLFAMQTRIDCAESGLPAYDHALLERELGIFSEWFLGNLLGLSPADYDAEGLQSCYAHLIDNALAQPRVFVHRDFHSRNLMVLDGRGPGVLDFQDAVIGPVTYDLVSLLRDCYVAWPQASVELWTRAYWQRLTEAGLIDVPVTRFMHWFDLMGMQRHLKAIGIFARLKLRDGKPGYIADIPRVLSYVHDIAGRYEVFASFSTFLREAVDTRFTPELSS